MGLARAWGGGSSPLQVRRKLASQPRRPVRPGAATALARAQSVYRRTFSLRPRSSASATKFSSLPSRSAVLCEMSRSLP